MILPRSRAGDHIVHHADSKDELIVTPSISRADHHFVHHSDSKDELVEMPSRSQADHPEGFV